MWASTCPAQLRDTHFVGGFAAASQLPESGVSPTLARLSGLVHGEPAAPPKCRTTSEPPESRTAMSAPTSLRQRLEHFIEARLTQRAIIALILLNAVTLGLETSDTVMGWMGPVILTADAVILSIFTAEVLAKLFVYRLSFWRNPWNVFDFFVVGIALIPASGPFSVLRVLRLLRLVSMVPKLRFIVEALLRAIPGIVSSWACWC